MRRATTKYQSLDRRPALMTGKTCPAIDLMAILKGTESSDEISIALVLECRSLLRYCPLEHLEGRIGYAGVLFFGQTLGSTGWAHAGQITDLISIDVADSRNNSLVKQQRLERHPAVRAETPEPLAGQLLDDWITAEMRYCAWYPTPINLIDNEQLSEGARIDKSQFAR